MPAEPRISSDELSAYFALRRAGDRLGRAVAAQLRKHALSEIQFMILAQLRESGEQRMSDVADTVVTARNALTYQAEQLERRNLISRRTSDGDARCTLIRLAPQGELLLGQVFPEHVTVVRELFLDRLTAAQLSAVSEGLRNVGVVTTDAAE